MTIICDRNMQEWSIINAVQRIGREGVCVLDSCAGDE